MTTLQAVALIAVMALVTFLTLGSALPTLWPGRYSPRIILYLGTYLPAAVIAMLIVYCLRNVTFAQPAGWAPAPDRLCGGGRCPYLETQQYAVHCGRHAVIHGAGPVRLCVKYSRRKIFGGNICYVSLIGFC